MNPAVAKACQSLKLFSAAFFKVKDKDGFLNPFLFNSAQDYIDYRLDAQLKETGRVRAIVLKGRQTGCSTYTQARYFKKTISEIGKKAFILTHEADATDNIFGITKRYLENLPDGLCPKPQKSNQKKLKFREFQSEYAVGTAKNSGTGRSQTIQLFHGSEVAYWPNSDLHEKGVIQSVSGSKGTEIILESTANGIGNYFHRMWVSASRGESEYQAIFVPWFWQREYTAHTPNFKPDDEEIFLLDMYSKEGMTKQHLAWRRLRLSANSKDPEKALIDFKTEYPNCPDDAFQNPIDNVFIPSRYVIAAMNNEIETDAGLIIGVDPARGDIDRTAIIRRRGRKAYKLQTLRNRNTMQVAGIIVNIIKEERPHKVYIDSIGIGAGIVDRLNEMGYSYCEGVMVSRQANNKEAFANLRAELWSEMKDWLMGELPVELPNDDDLHTDLCGLGFTYRSNGQLLIEDKESLKKRGLPSCDTADALMLTFYAGQYALQDLAPVDLIPERHHTMWM